MPTPASASTTAPAASRSSTVNRGVPSARTASGGDDRDGEPVPLRRLPVQHPVRHGRAVAEVPGHHCGVRQDAVERIGGASIAGRLAGPGPVALAAD